MTKSYTSIIMYTGWKANQKGDSMEIEATVRGINRAVGNKRFTAIAVQPFKEGFVTLGYEGDGGEKDYYTQGFFRSDSPCGLSSTGGHYCMSFQEAVADFNVRLSH